MARLTADTSENRNTHHEAIQERARAFQEAVRRIAYAHGFEPVAAHLHADYEEWDIRLELEYKIDFSRKTQTHELTIRLEEGRHEAL